jgi:hypothetical protein
MGSSGGHPLSSDCRQKRNHAYLHLIIRQFSDFEIPLKRLFSNSVTAVLPRKLRPASL